MSRHRVLDVSGAMSRVGVDRAGRAVLLLGFVFDLDREVERLGGFASELAERLGKLLAESEELAPQTLQLYDRYAKTILKLAKQAREEAMLMRSLPQHVRDQMTDSIVLGMSDIRFQRLSAQRANRS